MPPTWEEQWREIRRLREERNRRDDELYATQNRLRKALAAEARAERRETELPAAHARHDPRPALDIEALKQDYEEAKRNMQSARKALHETIGRSVPAHPREPLRNLPDDIPFLLLPLRIETRFTQVDDSPELWLRVYPDDIAIHTHEKTLSDKEVEAGERYWSELWQAGPSGDAATEDKRKKSWSYLADKFGAPRAAWIAKETKPINWDSDPRAREPEFSEHDLTKSSAWSRAPRTDVLPDRLVVLLYQGDKLVEEVEGKLIPDELFVGPDPLEEGESFATKDGKLVFGEPFAWASDFEQAVKSGMGFKISLKSLTPEQASAGFSKVVVLGVMLSADRHDGRKALEALIENHRYSPKGFAIVRQGTPTNNTDEGAAGYTKSDPFNVVSYYTDTGEPLFTERDDADGRVLADALGIDYAPVQYIANADATDQREAAAMNTALYPGTLGYYFDTLLAPVLGEAMRQMLREFFIEHVRGRGAVPAIRVGNQPYGVLLTSDFGRWQWAKDETGRDPAFFSGLHATLMKYHAIWLGLLGKLAHVGNPSEQPDPSAVLMDVLGLQAGSVAFNQRTAYSTDYLLNHDSFQYGGRYFEDVKETFTSKGLLVAFLQSLGYNERADDGALKVPQLLRLVFQHFHTSLDASNLVDGVPLSETEAVRDYDAALKKNYLDWLAETRTVDALERQDFGPGLQAPNALLYMILRRALLLQLHAASVQWFLGKNIDLSPTLAAINLYNIRPEPSLTKWEVMRAKVGVAIPEHPFQARAISDHLLTSGRTEQEAAFLNRVREAVKSLADLPTARLERLLTEHIDTCTYRLDSWQAGMFNLRLRHLRMPTEGRAGEQRRTGIFLGAFGWVENLRPAARVEASLEGISAKLLPPQGESLYEYRDNGGFVHAPSLNHASAAAVLRSGYVSHANSAQPEAMAVNLSSERVRRALFLLRGVRNGQVLEALLGYQFERELHDAASADAVQIRLNEYIYDFRAAFPIEQHLLRQQGSNEPIEAIPANNVVNGVKLAEAKGDVPYGATGSVSGASPAEQDTIRNAKQRLADSLDAVKDLLLSEGVFQVVQGNVDRAGAVMTAMKDTNIPPEIDVINTPRSSHFSFTNRVTVQFDDLDPDDPASNPWTDIAMTPRARMEPGMNRWLGTIIGDPKTLVCRVAHLDSDGDELGSAEVSVDKLALQPIDLVYLTGSELNTGASQDNQENRTSASELEVRIAWFYRTLKGLDDAIPVRIQFVDPAHKRTLGKHLLLLRILRSLISDSRPLHALDFDPPSKKSAADPANPEGYDAATLGARVQAALSSSDTLRSAIDTMAIDAVVADEDGVDHHFVTLKDAFQALTVAKLAFGDIGFTFSDGDATQLQSLLRSAATMGMSDAFPVVRNLAGKAKAALLDQARSVSRRMAAMASQAAALITEAATATAVATQVRLLIAAGKAIHGEAFNILPRFRYNNETDIQLSHADRAQLLQHATAALGMTYPSDEWLQNVAHVRPRVARWDTIRSLHEAFTGVRLSAAPIQLPFRAKDSWLAVEFPEKDPHRPEQPFNIEHDTLAVTIHGNAAFAAGSKQCGLLIDDWTETIPTKSEITGIAFNYDQPAAAPPQALLLAVTPQRKGHWTWEDLLGIVNDTLLRSKLRAVEPRLLDEVDKPEVGVLLPGVLADFSQLDMNLALDFRTVIKAVAETTPIVSVAMSAHE
jgi:hypothetical protein